MNKQTTLLSILFVVVVALASCRGGNNTSLSQADGDTVALKYSSLLTIVEHDGYVVADIKNPWKPGKMLHRYYLVPRTSDIKLQTSDLTDGTVIEVPIQRAAVFTTVHCALLTELGWAAILWVWQTPSISRCLISSSRSRQAALWTAAMA